MADIIRKNDHDEFPRPDQWVDLYGDYLYRYAITRLSDRKTAEDVVQDTFLAALEGFHKFAGRSSLSTWLTGILKRKIIDHFRKATTAGKFKELIREEQGSDGDYISEGAEENGWKSNRRPSAWNVNPENDLERQEFWKFLQLCLKDLPSEMVSVFVLREMEEMDNKEICNTLGLTATNVRVLLHRGRAKLRRCLEKGWLSTNSDKSRP